MGVGDNRRSSCDLLVGVEEDHSAERLVLSFGEQSVSDEKEGGGVGRCIIRFDGSEGCLCGVCIPRLRCNGGDGDGDCGSSREARIRIS